MHYYLVPRPLALIGLGIFSLFAIINITGTIGQLHSLYQLWRADNAEHYTYIGSDYPSSLPVALKQVALTVEHTNRYGLKAPHDWASLFPEGNGWVRLGPDGRRFSVAMYHQLHCLNALRHALVQAREAAGYNFNSSGSSSDPIRRSPARPLLPPETPAQSFSHADHCFNYLRQAILCAADTTIEVSQLMLRPDGVEDSGASGLGMTHTCRDWTQLREFLEDNSKEWVQRDGARA